MPLFNPNPANDVVIGSGNAAVYNACTISINVGAKNTFQTYRQYTRTINTVAEMNNKYTNRYKSQPKKNS